MSGPLDLIVLWLSLLPFLAAIFGPALTARMGHRAGWVLAAAPLLLFLLFASYVPAVAAGEATTVSVAWIPSLDVRFGILIDGLSLTFALLITGIGTFIVVYAGGYLKGHPLQGRFFSFILLFMGAMLGLVLADDLIALFVFWELTSITSFLLIGFDHQRETARRAALQALVITGLGGLALLAGLIVIRLSLEATSLSALLADPDIVRESGVYLVVLTLVLIGCFTKSAQVPFHSWLPNAMEAPTPVSAYLHSATMVKAGVYLLMRLQPVLGETAVWETILPMFGGATLITGTLLALKAIDLKQILAYTTVASLGLLVLLTGFAETYALAGAVGYLVAHSLFKGGLFMIAGAIDHEAGAKDITKLGGLAPKMPITFVATLLATLSMAGLPPFFGFVAKEVMYDGLWQASGVSPALVVVVVGNAIMFAIAALLLVKPFFGRRKPTPKAPHEGPPSLWLGAIVLGVLGPVSALLLSGTIGAIVAPMTAAVAGREVDLSAIHLIPSAIKPPVVLTLITIALGIAIYAFADRARAAIARVLDRIGWGPDLGFDQAMRGLLAGAHRVTGLVQGGYMRTYVRTVFVVLAVALVGTMAVTGEWPRFKWIGAPLVPYYLGVLAVAVIGLMIVVNAGSRQTAIISLGIQGAMVALIFMLYGAPDLSFTQFMIEILSVIILTLVMTRLNLRPQDHRPASTRYVDGTIAAFCGLGFAMLLIAVVDQPLDMRLSDFFGQYAYVIAQGHNVVNVILVDFRALDTWGEIAVVMAAGLAIVALIGLRFRPLARAEAPLQPAAEPFHRDAPAGPASQGIARGAETVEDPLFGRSPEEATP